MSAKSNSRLQNQKASSKPNCLVEFFEKPTINIPYVLERLREEGYISSDSRSRIIKQKLIHVWLLFRRKRTTHSVNELIDFVFNDKVFITGQRVKLVTELCTYYGIVGDVSWSNGGIFLEGRTVSFKIRSHDGSFSYSTISPEVLKLWDGTYPQPEWINGGGNSPLMKHWKWL